MAPVVWKSNRWSNLQDDLLESVTSRLRFEDLIRFSFVCKSWKSFITTRSSSSLSPKPHLWLIDPDGSDYETLSLKNVYNGQIYEVDTPQLLDHRICGSCLGGLLITTHEDGTIQVFHPLSKELIHLPPVSKFPDVQVETLEEDDVTYVWYNYPHDNRNGSEYHPTFMRDFFLYKVILSSNRSIAVAIYGRSRRLGFCRIGKDETWTALNVQGKDTCGFQDVIFYQGKFYAVRNSGAVFVVSGLETESPFIKLVIHSPPSYEEDDEYDFEGYSAKYYLVESLQGEMMLITRILYFRPHCEGGKGEYETVVFRVEKLDVDKWLRVKDFGNDSSIFVGENHSFSISNSDLPFSYNEKRNYVFFTDDYMDLEQRHGGDDIGKFDLKNGDIHMWDCGGFFLPRPVWFTTISM